MIKVFSNSSEIEKIAKEKFAIPDFIMMENAARNMSDFILNLKNERAFTSSVLIVCGKGNNGADGLALARLLYGNIEVFLYCFEEPSSKESISQYEMCKRMNIPFCSKSEFYSKLNNHPSVVVDCLYGTGFHGELSTDAKELLDAMNSSQSIHLACDIPSGLYFKADYTITMGLQKIQLYSDLAKANTGKIIQSNIGIPISIFEEIQKTSVYLLEKCDMKLPYRTDLSSHKGKYGHTTVFSGEKAGASILAATAALNFGTGLSTIKTSGFDNLSQFKISPELMISTSIPEKTTCIVAGSGLGRTEQSFAIIKEITDWMKNTKNPACVLDADIFYYPKLKSFLTELNNIPEARIILTPHPKELESISKLINIEEKDSKSFKTPEFTQKRLEFGQNFTKVFPNITLIMKSAITYIAHKEHTYIFDEGSPSLAKAGSGDVLAGLCGALLSQNYDSLTAAKTAVQAHGYASSLNKTNCKHSFTLTPESLINNLKEMY